MKFFKEHLILNSIIIVLLLLFLSGCTENQKDISSIVSGENAIDTSGIISCCAKEESEEKLVYFNFPQLKETTYKANEINKLITEFVLSTLYFDDFNITIEDFSETWNWDNDDYKTMAMKIDYRIVRNDPIYFSVVFEGMTNYKVAAHPNHNFYSLTIDIEKNRIVKLSDLYNINMNFVQLIRKEFKEQSRLRFAEKTGTLSEEVAEYVEDLLSDYADMDLLNWLCLADTIDSGFYSFLTDMELGISIPLSFAMGNHIEIMISYDKLKEYIK